MASSTSASFPDTEEKCNTDNNLPSTNCHPENQYLDLVRNIIENGEDRPDRTGTGTRSLFVPETMRFSLKDDIFPLLTTKRVFFRGVAQELLWFLRAETSSLALAEQGVHIWDANGSREFLDSRGFPERSEGDLGPVYGFQWRHYGAEYQGVDCDYKGKGVDQIAEVVRLVREDPYSRRIILCAWNAGMNHLMALPPCHVLAQFYVSATTGALSCVLYQRSGDVGLGVPFNIASYALLTRMIAHVTNRPCGEFVHIIADAHVYRDHIDALRVQLEREPRDFPKLRFSRQVSSIDDFRYEDFIIEGYSPHGKLDMKMSV